MTRDLNPRPRPHRILLLWLGYWLGLLILMHVPTTGLRRLSFHYADNIIHLVLYYLLVWLGGRYLFATGRAVSTTMLVGYAGIYALYAAFEEWSQQFVGRSMSFSDWLTDIIGISLATAWLVFRRRSNTVPNPSRQD